MTKFYIIARVNGKEYMTKVLADSANQAEHMALDRGIRGVHEYGCDACMAYDAEMMKTDTFIGAALWAEPVSVNDLMEIIDVNNERIMKRDAAEHRKNEIHKEILKLKSQLADLGKEYDEMRKILAE